MFLYGENTGVMLLPMWSVALWVVCRLNAVGLGSFLKLMSFRVEWFCRAPKQVKLALILILCRRLDSHIAEASF